MQHRLVWLFGAFVLILAMAAFHFYGLENFMYWRYWWYDIPMHMLGGAALGSFLIALSPKPRRLFYLLLMIGIGVGWEIMEYVGGITTYEPGYVFDTSLDLLDDTIGAIVIYVLARFTIWR